MLTRRIFAVLMSVLFFVPELPAKARPDWSEVEKLKQRSMVRVFLWDGRQVIGEFESADAGVLKIAVYADPEIRIGSEREFQRAQVRAVYRTPRSQANPEKYLKTGIVVGGVGGAIVGGVATGKAWPLGVVLGGATGAMLGTMVGGVAGVGDVVFRGHHAKLVYESTRRPVPGQ